MDLGALLKEQRRRLGRSQVVMARVSGISASILSRIENGFIKKPAEKKLQEIARAYQFDYTVISSIIADLKRYSKKKENIVPLLRAVLESGCEYLEETDFSLLLRMQRLLKIPITPVLIREMLLHSHGRPADIIT